MSHSSDLRPIIDALTQPGPILDAFGVVPTTSGPTAEVRAVLDQLSGQRPTSSDLRAVMHAAHQEPIGPELDALAAWLGGLTEPPDPETAGDRFWSVFQPELVGVREEWEQRVEAVRQERAVTVVHPCEPVTPDGVLLTTNALIGPPLDGRQEPPDSWFDHPIPLDAEPEASEIVHGLVALDAAMAFERVRGTITGPVDVVVSVSPTHHRMGHEATEATVRSVEACGTLENLRVFVFDEESVRELLDEILAPAIGVRQGVMAPIGVVGPYGRHFSFLRGIAALWQAAVDPTIDATFKIDLDQVFPQERLVASFGRSALELMSHPSWGSLAVDSSGETIELGMAAGTLVNAADIGRGLLVPDVTPGGPESPADLVFSKRLPQALSTEAEMMNDGSTAVHERIHVTGGTSGIRIDAWRRTLPFTPSFVGRAEDQAYQLGTFDTPVPGLRTLHLPGLVMRHDAAVVATPSAARESVRTEIGDIERFLVFSAYGSHLGMGRERLLPFTGGYISERPVTTALLRLGARVVEVAASGDVHRANDLLRVGLGRLEEVAAFIGPAGDMVATIDRERSAWQAFSEAVDLAHRDPGLAERVRAAVNRRRIGHPA